ncbi:MAG: ATP-dependent metallopeptidase FtsH/Yme1/Tma family protein, partial [Dehalococcoidales bacterium]|nr:ATP-dependent metallopeptidase FtsH/Yme1/Tma family protein [Dehalococcoidales bacterium]
ANLVNEAAILAAKRNRKTIGMNELEESIDRVSMGPERKSRKMSDKEKEITAYHEAGHALVAKLLPNSDPVHKVTIVPRGMAGGYTKQLPIEDRHYYTRSYLKDRLASALGGRAAEQVVFNEITSGAKQDIEQVTKLARSMVTDYGMSDKLGPRTFGHKEEMVFLGREISEQRDYSEKVALQIDMEVKQLIDTAYQIALQLLTDNREKLGFIAKMLLEEETLEGDELKRILGDTPLKGATPKVRKTKTPVPIGPVAEGEKELKPKEAPGLPRLVPKQTPAPSD